MIGPTTLFRNGRPHDEAAAEAAGIPSRARTSPCRSISAPARHRRRYGPATSARSTCGSTRSIEREPAAPRSPVPRHFLSVVDFDAADLERCLELAIRMKAERSLGVQAPTAADPRGPVRGDAVREAVAPDADDVRDRRAGAGRRRSSRCSRTSRWAAASRSPTSRGISSGGSHAVVIRTFSQRVLEEFAAATSASTSSTR